MKMKMKMNKRITTAMVLSGLVTSMMMGNLSTAASKVPLVKTKLTIEVNKSATVKVKKAYRKKVKKITFSSSKKKIATVSKKGKIKARKVGSTNIKVKVTLKNGKKLHSVCKVKVKAVNSNKKASTKVATTSSTQTTVKSIHGTMKTCSIETEGMKNELKVQLYQKVAENQLVSTYQQLQNLITSIENVDSTNSQINAFVTMLKTYDESFFKEKSLCLGNMELTYGYDIALSRMVYESSQNNTGKFKMYVTKTQNVQEGTALLDVMIYHVCIGEVNTADVTGCKTVECISE